MNVIYYPSNSKNSHIQQWNVQFERQFGASMSWNLGYMGTKMSNLATAFNANTTPLCPAGSACPTQRWPDLFGNVNEYGFLGSGTYNGLQTSFNRRLSRGLQFTSAYAWSHTIDNSNGAFSATVRQNNGGARIFVDSNGNPILSYNKGNADQDIRHSFVFASMYEIPFGKGRQYGADLPVALDYIIGGWQWNNIVTLQTGSPIDLTSQGAAQGNRPDITGPVSAFIDHSTGKGVITGNFSCAPSTGGNCSGSFERPGTLGRNTIFGPGYHTWDMGMMKDIKMAERAMLEFRADVFNLFNHPQFTNSSFNTSMGTGGTGTTSGASTRYSSERQLQFAVRITF